MKSNTLLLIGAVIALYLFFNQHDTSAPTTPMPTTPCPQGGVWMWGTNPLGEGYHKWICVGSNLVLPITLHSDGHYYDATGKLVS